jgi:hypothetical protein
MPRSVVRYTNSLNHGYLKTIDEANDASNGFWNDFWNSAASGLR